MRPCKKVNSFQVICLVFSIILCVLAGFPPLMGVSTKTDLGGLSPPPFGFLGEMSGWNEPAVSNSAPKLMVFSRSIEIYRINPEGEGERSNRLPEAVSPCMLES